MGWEFEIQRAYLQKLADKILPGTIIRNTELTKKAFEALQEKPEMTINAYASGGAVGYWPGAGGIYTSTGIIPIQSPQGKTSEWSFTHSGERTAITLNEKDTLETVKETAESALKNLRTMVSKRTPEI